MTWEMLWILVAVVVVGFLFRKIAFVSDAEACRYLQEGALVLDVRNPSEFKQGHVPGAINIPLSDLPDGILSRVSDKGQVLLLHCQGGGRSAVAKRLLRAKGYRRAYNLGSLGRAERLARASRPTNLSGA